MGKRWDRIIGRMKDWEVELSAYRVQEHGPGVLCSYDGRKLRLSDPRDMADARRIARRVSGHLAHKEGGRSA